MKGLRRGMRSPFGVMKSFWISLISVHMHADSGTPTCATPATLAELLPSYPGRHNRDVEECWVVAARQVFPVTGSRETPCSSRCQAVSLSGRGLALSERLTRWVEVSKRDLAVPAAPGEMGVASVDADALASRFPLADTEKLGRVFAVKTRHKLGGLAWPEGQQAQE